MTAFTCLFFPKLCIHPLYRSRGDSPLLSAPHLNQVQERSGLTCVEFEFGIMGFCKYTVSDRVSK